MTIGLGTALVALILLFVVAPGLFLRLGLLLYPKDHDRRMEFEAEFHYVPRRARYGWVAGQLARSVREAPSARSEARREALRLWQQMVEDAKVHRQAQTLDDAAANEHASIMAVDTWQLDDPESGNIYEPLRRRRGESSTADGGPDRAD